MVRRFVYLLWLWLVVPSTAVAELPRTSDGKPDLNGIWQTLDPHDVGIETHPALAATIIEAGALGASRASRGAVIGGRIPYSNDARAVQQENFENRLTLDPVRKCYLPGVPRANLMPYPLQIVQIPDHVFIAYEFAQASRTLYLDRPDFEAPVDTWMGHSIARWDEDTLVVKVTAQVPDTWLDGSGNYHTQDLVVEERYTLISPYHLEYQATLTDPSIYTQPWTLRATLYKNVDPHAQLLDFKCVEFVEELMYGHLAKPNQAVENQDGN